MPSDNEVTKYFKAVNEGYEALVDAIEKSTRHSGAIWERLIQEVRSGQRESLSLGERLAAQPADAQTYTALLESTLKTQERALAFAKLVYEEASGASADGRSAFERLVSAQRSAAQAAIDLTNAWTGGSPFADAWRKGVEAMTQATASTAAVASNAARPAPASVQSN